MTGANHDYPERTINGDHLPRVQGAQWLLSRLKGIGIAYQHKHHSTEIPTRPGGT